VLGVLQRTRQSRRQRNRVLILTIKGANMKRLVLVLMAVACLVHAGPAIASPLELPTTGPGNSWIMSWSDWTQGKEYDKTEFFITAGPSTFDAAAMTSEAGWVGVLVNPTYTYIAGPAATVTKTLTLSFFDPQPLGGIRIDILVPVQA
jgi:hypothetical protein